MKTNRLKKLAAVTMSVVVTCTALSSFASGAEQSSYPEVERDRIEKIIAGMTLQEKAGQMIMADFQSWTNEEGELVPITVLPAEVQAAISRDFFGGVILFSGNCNENAQTLRLIDQMQQANLASNAANPVPLLIATDQEGGAVTRLGEGTRWPGNMALAATQDPENAQKAAACLGEELSALSINTDFAPVLDVNNNPANPVIGVRSFSDNPAVVARFGVKFLKGLQESGTITALKHFPGHGDVHMDSHTDFPILNKTYDELKECELIPFQAAIDAGADMVMTAHIQYPQIETNTRISVTTGEKIFLPATFSHRILTEILRQDMGFEGVIVSDALNMKAITENFALEDVCTLAIEAGVDMFLMPVPVQDADTLAALEAFEARICELVEKGLVSQERLDESVRRILTMKAAHGLLEPPAPQTEEEIQEAAAVPGNSENLALEWELTKKAITLLKNEGSLLPIQAEHGDTVLFLYSAESRMGTSEYARLRLVQEGLLPEDVRFEAMTFSLENREECLAAAADADIVIGVTTVLNTQALDPTTEAGAKLAILDEVIVAAHNAGGRFILLSTYLPYDAARFQEADAIVVTYGSLPMNELPAGHQTCSPNIPAAICGIFGEYEFTGKLPVELPGWRGQ